MTDGPGYEGPGLVAGAIGRGVVDAADAGISEAYARYLERLAEFGAAAGEHEDEADGV